MTISRRGISAGLLVGLLTAGPGAAQSVQEQVIAQLQAQGFTIEEVRRTFLGRVRVEARRGDVERELVFDPRNGTILRDYTENAVVVRVPERDEDWDDDTGTEGYDDDADDDRDDDDGGDGDDGGDDDDDDDDGGDDDGGDDGGDDDD